jgi:hypothetical protein
MSWCRSYGVDVWCRCHSMEERIAAESFRSGFNADQFHLPVPEFAGFRCDRVFLSIPSRYLSADQGVSTAIVVLIGFAGRVASAEQPPLAHLLLRRIKRKGMRNRLETSQEQIGLPSDRTDKNYRNKFSPHKRSVAADPDSHRNWHPPH